MRAWKGVAAALAAAGILWACGVIAPSPDVSKDWAPLLADLRGFEQSIGFRETGNFREFSAEREGYPFCGHTPKLTLPYSYQDPAIRWVKVDSEEECRRIAGDADVFYGISEALGEVGSPVTGSMVSGKLDRFVYLVIHEDCHDQFDLPYGVEEALCEFVAYRAMAQFAEQRYRWYAGEGRAIRRYAEEQAGFSRATVLAYEELAKIYARYERGEITRDAALREREAFFARTARTVGWTRGPLNNVGLANNMTYTRHYALVESAHELMGRDLRETVRFFRMVDAIKPARETVIRRLKVPGEEDIRFVKTYEELVIDAAKKLMQQRGVTP